MRIFFLDHNQRFTAILESVVFNVADGATIDDFTTCSINDDVFAFFFVVLGLDEDIDIVVCLIVEMLFKAEDGDFRGCLGGVSFLC